MTYGDRLADARRVLEEQATMPKEPFDRRRFEQAPCYRCGYNGHSYYQPDVHLCAELYHMEPISDRTTWPARSDVYMLAEEIIVNTFANSSQAADAISALFPSPEAIAERIVDAVMTRDIGLTDRRTMGPYSYYDLQLLILRALTGAA